MDDLERHLGEEPAESTAGMWRACTRYIVEEMAEDYKGGRVTRREFLRRLSVILGGMAAAVSLAASLGCGPETEPTPSPTAVPPSPSPAPPATPTPMPEPGITVRPDDPALEAGPAQFPSEGITYIGYLARPKPAGAYPAVLVIHENRGLVPPHYQDIARRLAKEGYVALALDLVSREGGTARIGDEAQVISLIGQISRDQPQRLVADMSAGISYLQGLPYVRRDRVGAIGFCFGGGMVWLLAVRNPDLRAAVPFYGPRPPLEEVPNLRAAVLGIYAGNDTRINAAVPELEAALKQNNKTYKFITYPGADHAFFNDAGQRYHAEASRAAWAETLAWLNQYLKA